MIAIDAKVTGVAELNRRLEKAAQKLKNPKSMFAEVAGYIHGTFQKNMQRGIDPDGKPLKPVARWTRIVSKGGVIPKGTPIPLNNTGGLRNAMSIWDLSNRGVMIGWKGKYLKVADDQTNGRKGEINLRENRIKGRYTGVKQNKQGGEYFSVKDGSQWWSRRVKGGVTPVKPAARKFFYLTRKQIQRSGEIADKYVAGAIK